MSRVLMGMLLGAACWLGPSKLADAEEILPDPSESTFLEAARPDALEEQGPPMRISMEFQDASLRDILKLFSQQTGINIIAADEVSEKKLTVYFEEVTVLDALDQILRAGNLKYERLPESEIYVVTSRPKMPDPGIQTITRVYRLKYARVSESVLAKAAAILGDKTPFESPIQLQDQTSSAGSSSSTSENEEDKVGIDTVISELLTEYGKVVVDGRTNSLIITDVPENFPRLEGALAALDIRTAQILVDTELIETTLSKLKDLGVEWGTGTEGDLITFTPTSRTTRFPFNLFGEGIQPTDPTPFTASTLSAASFRGVLQALESDTDTKVLARPKVLTLDNESALIRLTSDEAIGFSTSSQAGTDTVTSEPERATTGVFLVVTPQVNERGNITMIVEPSVTKTVASKITAPTGAATPRDPKTRSSRTVVRVKSGDTLVVGGLIDRVDEHTMRRVPVLASVPVLGEVFKNQEISDSASELIVFVTPKILEEHAGSRVAVAPGPGGPRAQEPAASAQDAMEQSLNRLEQQPL
jgi:type II secretory pathway component GspD/PulD (secretin)